MEVTLVTRTKALELLFGGMEPRRASPVELDELLAEPPAELLLYIDFASMGRRSLPELIERLSAARRLHWAVIDRGRVISDPAALFHAGALDYIGPEATEGFITPQRVETVLAYAARSDALGSKAKGHKARMPAFQSWNSMVEGKSYELLVLYLGIWDAEGLRTRLGEGRFSRLKASALGLANGLIQEHGGQLWISDDRSFLALFQPEALNGLLSSCISLLANMRLISYEQFRLEQEVGCLSMALQRCTLPWQKPGQTGTIVSDAINYIYHLGRKYTAPCVIDLVDDAAHELNPRLETLLCAPESFEGKSVRRFAGFATTGAPPH